MDFQRSLAEIHDKCRDRIQAVHQELFSQALELLQEDIRNPQLTSPDASPDAFLLRANQIGIALIENDFFSVAERLYGLLADTTLKYREETGNWRHAGALFANLGTAYAAQGNFDRAIVVLLKAVREDERTYKVVPKDSFAIKGMLQQYFIKPIQNEVLTIVQKVNHPITLGDVERLSGILGSNEYAFLSYAYIAIAHEEAEKVFPNDFSHLQILTALRNLSALLEVVLKNLSGTMDETFYPTIKGLFDAKSWWRDFENARIRVGATQKSKTPVDKQLSASISITPADTNSLFWKSLLIAYITRNYTAHQMDFSGKLIQTYSQDVLGHILNVMISATAYK